MVLYVVHVMMDVRDVLMVHIVMHVLQVILFNLTPVNNVTI